MRTFVRSTLFSAALALGATGLMAEQPRDHWLDQWFKAKYGRITPMEEAHRKAERDSTAFREDTSRPNALVGQSLTEQSFKAKFGRNAPAVEARLQEEQASTAFREETTSSAPATSWSDEWHRAKYGRLPGR